MTNQEAYEKVREACVKANPEIIELKTGCRVKYSATGEVEYWYGARCGGKNRIKAKPETAKNNVPIRDYDLETKIKVLSSRTESDNLVEEKYNTMFARKWGDEKRWAKVSSFGDGTDWVYYLNLEILGRDIRLADILLALPKDDMGLHVSANCLCVEYVNRFIKNRYFDWNLKHDSLEWHRDNQPETVRALAEIIG